MKREMSPYNIVYVRKLSMYTDSVPSYIDAPRPFDT
jgi:hypothetical protein